MSQFSSMVLATTLASVIGCGGSAANTPSTPTSASACAALATARCALRDRCTEGVYNVRTYGDAGICEAQELANCETALAAPGQGQTATTFAACATAVAAESCTPDYSMGITETACVPPAGSRAAGQSCTFSGQCQSSYCHIPIGAACGTCGTAPVVGDDCTASGECGRDIYCLKTATPNRCVLLVAAGGACDANSPCGGGLACVTPAGAAQGTCNQEGTTTGTPCDSANITAPTCSGSSGFYCGSGGVCQPLATASAGQPCGNIPDAGAAFCAGGGLCIAPGKGQQKVCIAPAAIGDPCDDTVGPPCLATARCVLSSSGGTAGTCAYLNPSACN